MSTTVLRTVLLVRVCSRCVWLPLKARVALSSRTAPAVAARSTVARKATVVLAPGARSATWQVTVCPAALQEGLEPATKVVPAGSWSVTVMPVAVSRSPVLPSGCWLVTLKV